jgi:glycosyltransferase involved in cell wall biosynthesis
MAGLRVLHLFSNYEWTGPAEPAISLVARLCEEGVDALLRSSGFTKGDPVNHVVEQARARGVEPVTDLKLAKHRAPWRDWSDVRRLRGIVVRESVDLVHCHLPNDTQIADRALRSLPIPWVRSLYATDPDGVEPGELERLRAAFTTFVFSERMEQALRARGFPPQRVLRLEAAVDLERFGPGPDSSARRSALGLTPGHFVAGIVARVQPQRRFDLLLDTAELVASQVPEFRLLVIGRGSKLESVAREPARRRGLLDRVVLFPGYFQGAEYVDVLRALDVKLFLVPGTDGTARAVREALACGLPVLATERGILPELIRDGTTGRVLEESPQAFARALVELYRNPEARRRMGEAARQDALRRFDPYLQARRVAEAYRAVLARAA